MVDAQEKDCASQGINFIPLDDVRQGICHIVAPNHSVHHFDIDPFRRTDLLEALDGIKEMLTGSAKIEQYEQSRAARRPWIFSAN